MPTGQRNEDTDKLINLNFRKRFNMQGQQIVWPKQTRQLWEQLLKVREPRQKEQQTKYKERYVLHNLDS